MSRLTRISILLAVCFALDKAAAFLRQVIIARQFSFSAELDAFNVANNVPDLIYAVISGGALAMALIPVLSATLTTQGRDALWRVFSHVANLVFLVTAALSIVVALVAVPLVRTEVGIAPGFGMQQQMVVVNLMRLNLIATLIFSLSGLVMSALQANQHFLFPALAPLFYNFGQIFGALILSPTEGYRIAGITLPALGMGVYGLVSGVILGAFLHLGIQIPALIRYRFRWSMGLGLDNPQVVQVLKLMAPRILTVGFVQVIFLVRDNLASRLPEGAVSALTYGWMIQQVPETLIGTAIATAMLPTLSELAAQKQEGLFHESVQRAVRVLIGITLPIAAVLAIGLGPLMQAVFALNDTHAATLLWATRGFLAGLMGHSLMEVAARSFYARQRPIPPMLAGFGNMLLYIGLGSALYRPLGAAGISLTDAVCFTAQAVFLLVLLGVQTGRFIHLGDSLTRAVFAALAGGGVTLALLNAQVLSSPLLSSGLAMAGGGMVALPFIFKELKLLLRL